MGKVTHEDHITILNLRHKGVSIRGLAELVRHSPTTIQKYQGVQPKDEAAFRKPRATMFDSFKDEIEALLNKDQGKQSHKVKTAMREFRNAHSEVRFGKSAFYDFVKTRCVLTREPKLARIPLQHDAGEAQIDFCEIRYIRSGKEVKGHQFTMVFPHSDMAFIQFFPAENQQCLFEAMRNVFEFIGFVPRTILFDNASTAVLTVGGKGKDAVPTKEYENFASFYGFEYKFCNPASGWEKGAVERLNEVLREDFGIPKPHIKDEATANTDLLKRCLEYGQRKHYLKDAPIVELFEQDRKAGHDLPKKQFDCRKTVVRTTDKCATISLKTCRYSVSDKHARRKVFVMYGALTLDIYDEFGKYICSHRRSYKRHSSTIDKGQYIDALAARPRARIKESDNEYVGELTAENIQNKDTDEILTEIQQEVASVRPAAREAAFVESCERRGLTVVPSPNERYALMFGLKPYNSDKEKYDVKIQSNGGMVQTTAAGRTVHTGGAKQKGQGKRVSTGTT